MFQFNYVSNVRYKNAKTKTEVILKRNALFGDDTFNVIVNGQQLKVLFSFHGGKYIHFQNALTLSDFLKEMGIEDYKLLIQ